MIQTGIMSLGDSFQAKIELHDGWNTYHSMRLGHSGAPSITKTAVLTIWADKASISALEEALFSDWCVSDHEFKGGDREGTTS